MKTELFKTSDLGLASALIASGFKLNDIDKSDPKKAIFLFDKTDDLESASLDYYNSKLQVSARTHFESIKMLKNRLYSV